MWPNLSEDLPYTVIQAAELTLRLHLSNVDSQSGPGEIQRIHDSQGGST